LDSSLVVSTNIHHHHRTTQEAIINHLLSSLKTATTHHPPALLLKTIITLSHLHLLIIMPRLTISLHTAKKPRCIAHQLVSPPMTLVKAMLALVKAPLCQTQLIIKTRITNSSQIMVDLR
jgi:hypothetical protein